jgi:hypothetical protein
LRVCVYGIELLKKSSKKELTKKRRYGNIFELPKEGTKEAKKKKQKRVDKERAM